MKAIGFCMLCIAVTFSLIELTALMDPIGFQRANDRDPFSPPPTWSFHLRAMGLLGVLYYVGYRWARTGPGQ